MQLDFIPVGNSDYSKKIIPNLFVFRIKIIIYSPKETYYLKLTKKRFFCECFIYTISEGLIK